MTPRNPAVVAVLAVLVASCATAARLAPSPRPVTAEDVLEEVRRPGASAVLVNVWATWCQPCREEMPDILALAREGSQRGLRIVLVSGDFEEDADEARRFLGELGVDFSTMIKTGPDQEFIDGLDPRWSGAMPATFVYDGAGNLRDFWEGKVDRATLQAKVGRVLGAMTPEPGPGRDGRP